MILSIGEILADVILDGGVEKRFCGGAPFNLIVNAKRQGASAGFIGRVGSDELGSFLISEAKKAELNALDIQVDAVRATTVAKVTLTDGERDFKFIRNNTADYNIDFESIDFSKYENLKIIHLGSLMLSEKEGVILAEKVVSIAKKLGVLLSFDVNFRTDIFKDENTAKLTYMPFINACNVLKVSSDELELFTGEPNVLKACKLLAKPNQLIVVTLGKDGSFYYLNGNSGTVPTVPVKPVDTTGAGDAFFGAFLAGIETVELTPANIESAMKTANEVGAKTTLFLGAIKL
ncbi:MAG: carbohydrate kinase [Clostridia bacterium]|nr:carbohydrate kinase [Clostridia bacterium]